MSDNIQSGPQPAASSMSLHDYEFQLAKMRFENSARVGKMIWLITLIAGLISVIVVVSVVVLALAQVLIGRATPDRLVMPDVLVNWGGIILGFYFGQFVNLLKDFMRFVPEQRELKSQSRP